MLYYSDKARRSHINRITELIGILVETPLVNVKGTDTIADTIKYLSEYMELVHKEKET